METIDRAAEKLALAQELNLTGYQYFISKTKDIEELLSMNFRPITEQAITKKLAKRIWHGWALSYGTEKDYLPLVVTICGSLFVSFFLLILPALIRGIYPSFLNLAVIGVALGPLSIYIATRFKKCQVRERPLDLWSQNLPYGAMLAVKEATQNGFNHFNIYYPTYQMDTNPLALDPIITAQRNGIVCEIFAWDDGKIYE